MACVCGGSKYLVYVKESSTWAWVAADVPGMLKPV